MRVAAALLGLSVALFSCASQPRQPDQWGESVLPNTPEKAAVNAYFHYRRQAILAQDPEIVWARFPDLRTGEDVPSGVNTEGLLTRSLTARESVDVIYDVDRYARVQMRTIGGGLVVRVHGLERYIQKDFTDGTSGEFILDLYLRRDASGWTVVRTDEMTLGELHDPATRP